MVYDHLTVQELTHYIYSHSHIGSAVAELEKRDIFRAAEVRRQLGWAPPAVFGWLAHCECGPLDFKVFQDRVDAEDYAHVYGDGEIHPVWKGKPVKV